MELALPNRKTYRAERDTTMGQIARETEGSERAALLQTLNDKLKDKVPEQLPVGAEDRASAAELAGPDPVLGPRRVDARRGGRLVVAATRGVKAPRGA